MTVNVTGPKGSGYSKRERTKRRIAQAARECFVEAGVTGTSVDDIVQKADISRATFYLHYSNKEVILLDLLSETQIPMLRIFARLRDLEEPSLDAVRGWLSDYLAAVSSHRADLLLSSLSVAYDDRPRALMVEQQRQRMALLGERYPAFRATLEDGAANASAILMIMEIEQLVFALAHGDVFSDPSIALEIVAQRLQRFLTQ